MVNVKDGFVGLSNEQVKNNEKEIELLFEKMMREFPKVKQMIIDASDKQKIASIKQNEKKRLKRKLYYNEK